MTYDANGNLTNDGTNTYVWDARNRLVSISGGATATFNYDALGRRTSKVIGSLTSQFLYDGNDIAAEIGGSAVGTSYLRSLNIDEPFIRQMGTGNEFYHADALGSSLVLSNAQGTSGTMYTYEPFGKTTITGTSANAFQYTGRESDGTGMYYYRARYYQPKLQRLVSEDLISGSPQDPQTIHKYLYALNSPLNYRDPLGLLVAGGGGGATLATPVVGADGTGGVVGDLNGNIAGIASVGLSVGPQLGLGVSPSVIIAPLASTVCDLQGQTFDIHLRLLYQLTVSIPHSINAKGQTSFTLADLKNISLTGDLLPGPNIGVGLGESVTTVSGCSERKK